MTGDNEAARPVHILLVEDSPGDARLTLEVLKQSKLHVNLAVVKDGVEGLDYLCRQGAYADASRPDLILLDLNLPRLDGRELLARIKTNAELCDIPVVILTTSKAEEDILRAYALHANCYVTKPVDLDQFVRVVEAIEDFWFTIVKLPGR